MRNTMVHHKEKCMTVMNVQDNYILLNFNDVPSAMVLMVQLLVVNNWHVFAEAYVTVAGPSAWLLFLSFYFVGVIAGTLQCCPDFHKLDALFGFKSCMVCCTKHTTAEIVKPSQSWSTFT